MGNTISIELPVIIADSDCDKDLIFEDMPEIEEVPVETEDIEEEQIIFQIAPLMSYDPVTNSIIVEEQIDLALLGNTYEAIVKAYVDGQ